MQKIKKQCEDVAHNGKNHENKSLMGPGEVSPVPPSRWACEGGGMY